MTLTSLLTKLSDFSVFVRVEVVFLEANIPLTLIIQHTYLQRISHVHAIFTIQEMIARCQRGLSKVLHVALVPDQNSLVVVQSANSGIKETDPTISVGHRVGLSS